MKEMKIFTKPMTDKERSENLGNPLKMPVRYHLVDCLKDLQFGRPAENQKQLQEWIDKLNRDLGKGTPFT